MGHLPCRLDESAALQCLRARRYGLVKWMFRPPVKAPLDGEPVPRFELVWMPYYIIPVNLSSPKGDGTIIVSVDAWAGGFALFERNADIIEGRPEGEIFDPKLGEGAAAGLARDGLLATVMRRRGQRKPTITGTEAARVVHFPYWVYYFQRRMGKLDILVVDAATGEIPGGRLRVAILDAFMAAP